MTPQPEPDTPSSFAEQYVRMSDWELMKLAASYDALRAPAQEALRGEFTRRKLEPPVIEAEGQELTSQPLVTVRRFRDLSEAIVGRTMLESAGIFCFLRDENVVRLDWAYSNLVGGLRLEVRPSDMAEAQQLLSQPIPEAIDFDGPTEYVQPKCPRCGSINLTFEGHDRSVALTSTFMLCLPLPLGSESWRCDACQCRWAEDEDDLSAPGDGPASS